MSLNHLKLMVDYCLGTPICDEVNRLGAVTAKTILDYGFAQHAEDGELVAATTEHNCILLTSDYQTINEKKYKPCEHGGIILLHGMLSPPDLVYILLKKFVQCGSREMAKGHVTHLWLDKAVIHTHKGRFKIPLG